MTPLLLLLGVFATQQTPAPPLPALDCRGAGRITVVFEPQSADAKLFAWLRDEIAHDQRTCVAAGGGRIELQAAFEAAGEKPPFLFVISSEGGPSARDYAARHGASVMGMVVVGPDAGAPAGARIAIVPRDPRWALSTYAVRDAIFDVIEAARTGASLPLTMRELSLGAGECVDFSSQGRLKSGVPFETRLPRGMLLRLRPERAAWGIVVSPAERPREDYMSLVSPPFQTAPQSMIGAGYSVTADQSAQIDRELRFAISERDYAFALRLHDVDASSWKLAKFRALGKGLLHIDFTGHGTAADGSLEWIEFRGRACVPRHERH